MTPRKHPHTFVLDDAENKMLHDAIKHLAKKHQINMSYAEGIRTLLRMAISKVLK